MGPLVLRVWFLLRGFRDFGFRVQVFVSVEGFRGFSGLGC